MDIASRLRSIEMLSHFSDQQIAALASCTAPVRAAHDAAIFEEGEETTAAYLVDSGTIDIRRRTPYGSYGLETYGAGAMFGESSFLDAAPRSCQAWVTDSAILFPLTRPAVESAVEDDQRLHAALYWSFWKSLSGKLRKTNEKLASFFSQSAGVPADIPAAMEHGSEIHVGINAKRDLFREQRLSRMEINFLSSLSKEQRLAPGEVLFREGEEGDRMYVLLEGRILITKTIADAGEEALAVLERGDYFGEMALIDRQPRSADAKAHDTGAVVLSISRDVLAGILDIQKMSSIRLLRLLCGLAVKRLREVDDKLIGWYIFDAGSGESLDIPDKPGR